MEELHYLDVGMFIAEEPVAIIGPSWPCDIIANCRKRIQVPCHDFRVEAVTFVFDIVKLEPALVLGTLLRLIK